MLSSRKADHIRISLEEDVRSSITTGLEDVHFIHQALPEINLDDVDLSQNLFNKVVKAPLLISSMTGGTPEAEKINMVLAQAAQQNGIVMGLGSIRAAIEDPEMAFTYQIRKYAPDILLFSNLGAVQLNYTYTVDHCRKAVEIPEADALILHLNPLQEAFQPEGNTNFSGLLNKIEQVCKKLSVPVIVKEIGWGIAEKTAHLLENVGVSAIDVAGAGGTSWSQVEMYRIHDKHKAMVAAAFKDWGIPTAQSIHNVRIGAPKTIIFASGGLQNGIDVAKCIALGATLGGLARPFLITASKSLEETIKTIHQFQQEIKICMFAVGATNLPQLRQNKIRSNMNR